MPKTILIVDDLPLNRQILKESLCHDYRIVEAENGREALRALREATEPVSAIVLDIVMPVMDGYQVLAELQHSPELSSIPVIVETGCAEEEAELRALSLGALDFIVTPYNATVIRKRIGNIIRLKEAAAEATAAARDDLTGLFSRKAFFELTEKTVAAQAPGTYVMACFDIDNFKVINDQYGTKMGDDVLRYVADTFQQGFAPHGGFCCRITADNFAVLYPAAFVTSKEIEQIRRRVSRYDSIASPITFSIGRYVVEDLSLSASAMFDRATLAEASIKGRYDVQIAQYDETMRDKLLHRQQLISEMGTALRDKQFEVWFQPQYNHSTGALIGSEALVRWRHPEKGLVPPDDFIPVFEKNGFIYELDQYVWEEVCRTLRRWIGQGRKPLPVSVNISRYDVFMPNLIDRIQELTALYEIPVELLRLEITESAFAKSAEQIIAVVKRFIDLGFTVEIDDFGSGYSSLNTLKDVPAQVLKLDMRFLEDSDNSRRGGNILESVVRMAKWLDMSVIAEGVETLEQANYLQSIGCNYVQGYLYAKPMPAGDYEALCRNAGKEERLLAMEAVETLNNNAFWDPSSMDTLIFNSYVGGACIFEVCNGKVELLRANEKYAQVLGDERRLPLEQAMKLPWQEHLSDEDRRILHDRLARSAETGDEITGEYVFYDLPGCPHETYLRTTMRVIAATGDRLLVYCTNENMTAQRKAERKEREAAERLQTIMENVDSAITAVSVSGDQVRYIFSNSHFYSMLGYTEAEYRAAFPDDFGPISPKDRDWVLRRVHESMKTGEPCLLEYRDNRRDGQEIWVRQRIVNTEISGIEGRVLLSIMVDISNEKRVELRERRASEQAQAIMDDVGSGITASIVRDGSVEFLFSNDRYYEVLGYTREQYRAEVSNLYDLIVPEDRERIFRISADAYRNNTSASMEYRIVRRDKTQCWVRAILTATRFTGVEEPVQLCVFTDISAEKRAEQTLRETDEQLLFLNETAHDLLAQPDSDKGILGTLQKLLTYFAGDRAYVFEFNAERAEANNTYEVCADGVAPERTQLQGVPLSSMSFWIRAFHRESYVGIADVTALDESRAEERRILSEQNIRSLVAVPLWRDGKLIGLIGIDNPRQQQTRVSRLAAIGDYLAVMLTRRDLNAKIQSDNAALASLMDDTPGGFVRMRVHSDGTIIPVFFNNGFLKLTDMSYDALMALYGRDAMAGVHPEDRGIVEEAVRRMLKNGEAHSAKYRLRRGEDGYLWLMFFGRAIRDASGELFLNIYYTDATEQNEAETLQRELLDNLPYGAALYEYDGTRIAPVHLNKRYWEIVGRAPVDYSTASILSAVHPDDRALIERELASALRRNCDVVCDVRILCGKSEYRPFHIVGRIVPKPSGHYAIYATYTPITGEALSYQEMLPIALATVISASSDLAYVKDRESRYICCSPAFAALLGHSEADIAGKTDYDLVERVYADQYYAVEREIAATGKAKLDYEEILPVRGHAFHYGSTSKYPLLDEAGNVIGIYGVTRDVTKYHTAYERLELLTNSIPGGIATYECTQQLLRITYFNDGFCKLFDCTREAYEAIAAENPLLGISEQDLPELQRQIDTLRVSGHPIDCTYRVRLKNGSIKWINLRAATSAQRGDVTTFHAVLFDVTQQQSAMEHLRISEEENRLAISHSGSIISRYTVATRTMTLVPDVAKAFCLPETVPDVPYGPVRQGRIADECVGIYIGLYEEILHGKKSGSALYKEHFRDGWHWTQARYSTIFSDAGEPVSAVISFTDATEQVEKDAAYRKWQQSLQARAPEEYSLFRCNISKNLSDDTREGSLLHMEFQPGRFRFNEHTEEYAEKCVYEEDRERFLAFLRSETLLLGYYRGKRSDRIEYREMLPDHTVRWLRLTVDLVEYPTSTDVEAYLMFENIDKSKREELRTKQLAETDPLTGVLNRAAFASRAEQLLRSGRAHTRHALLMLDIDGFKLVNDSFGHAAGDDALISLASALRSVLRRNDLLGRLGGDEFLILLNDIPNDAAAAGKAKRICALARKSFSLEVQISVSIGIAFSPRDGTDFETLYKKADAALYHVKGSGKNDYAFYREEMDSEARLAEPPAAPKPGVSVRDKRRMLIVDDSPIDSAMLEKLFCGEFLIEKATDGNSALIRLRSGGSRSDAVSIVLLDLMMPGFDGFTVLRKMMSSAEMRAIPVVVVSAGDRETGLRAIRNGASDFVPKPVDPELLRIRVRSAISKAENDRLRVESHFHALQEDEATRWKLALESAGIFLLELNPISGEAQYDASVSRHLAGRYDERSFWRILTEDAVTPEAERGRLQAFLRDAAEKDAPQGELRLPMCTPSGQTHTFRIRVLHPERETRGSGRLLLMFADESNAPSGA